VVPVTVLSLAACGGKARGAAVEAVSGAPATGGSGALAGAGGGGETITPAETSPPFDDIFPWFGSDGTAEFPPEGAVGKVLMLEVSGTPAQGTLSTHNLYDALQGATALEFSARASASLQLLTSARRTAGSYDYFAARDAGEDWPIARVSVGLDWKHYSVRLADMQPTEADPDPAAPGFSIAFIVDELQPVTLWLDDVRLTH
jgi:hypothetical protein